VTIPVRVPPELRDRINASAKVLGKSRGKWARDVFEQEVG